MSSEKISQIKANTALHKIAQESRSTVDDVLDIKLLISERKHPGACMRCLFNLYRKAPPRLKSDIDQVKTWLEKEIEVVATDTQSKELYRFPCQIREQALEDYCHRMMEESKRQIGPDVPTWNLEFRYCA